MAPARRVKRAGLLPCALAAAASIVVVDVGLHTAGVELSFMAPLSPLKTTRKLMSGAETHYNTFAGFSLAKVPLTARNEDLDSDGSHMEAGLPAVIMAATAMAAAAAADKGASKGGLWDSVKLPVYVGLWYFFNVQYNIVNKRLLQVFTAPWAVSWFQLAAGVPIALAMWKLGLVKEPSVTSKDLMQLAPVGAAFAAGQVATVASLGSVAVSFTHVVKALEPAVNAVGSALILGQVFHPVVYASLLPIFAGVALASSSELSFTMFGFLTAMASNFCFVARNVLATKYGAVGDMGEDKVTRKTNQLAVLTAVATLVLLPIALVLPGGLMSAPAAWTLALKKTSQSNLTYLMVASGVHFFMYQLSSFWVLSCVPPITHSVLNTLKRVVIIIVSILVFRTPVTPQSAAGTAIAIGGVLLYSLTKAHYSKKNKK